MRPRAPPTSGSCHRSPIAALLIANGGNCGENCSTQPLSSCYNPARFAYRPNHCPGDEIGRRSGLKIRRSLRPCRFDSGLGHHPCLYRTLSTNCVVRLAGPTRAKGIALTPLEAQPLPTDCARASQPESCITRIKRARHMATASSVARATLPQVLSLHAIQTNRLKTFRQWPF